MLNKLSFLIISSFILGGIAKGEVVPFNVNTKSVSGNKYWHSYSSARQKDLLFKNPNGGVYASMTERLTTLAQWIENGKWGPRAFRPSYSIECFTGYVQCIRTTFKTLDQHRNLLKEYIVSENIKCGQKKEKINQSMDWPGSIDFSKVKFLEYVDSNMKAGPCGK